MKIDPVEIESYQHSPIEKLWRIAVIILGIATLVYMVGYHIIYKLIIQTQ